MSESGSDFGGDSDASSVFEPVKPKKTAPKKAVAKPKKRAVPDSDDDLDADVTLDGTPPANKRQKVTAAAGKKKAAAKSLKSKKNEADEDEDEDENRPVEDYEIQEKYKTLNLREFILQRPDTHAGSMNPTEGDKPLWVIDNEGEMQLKNFSHIPVLYKCIDEVLVNAADNKVKHSDKMTWLKVTFDRKENVISICNNGPGIPIKMDDDMDMYNPQLVFGELMASSNFDDEMKKITGGRNGVGAKIANIFSTEFSIETQDNKHRYRQTWRNNMSEFDKPKITTAKGEQYTKVTWKPDLARFKIPEMDEDFEAFVHRRVVDMSATLGTKTYWNGDLIKKPRNFKQYCEMYIKALHKLEDEAEKKMELVFSSINEYWEIGFACSNGTAQQISFVNNIATTSGGTHVDYIANQLVTKINEVVKKKNKAAKVGPAQIKNHLFLFVNAKIVNPEFDSQSKIRLVSRPANFGSKCELPEDFIKKVLKSQVVTNILESATVKADKAAKRTDGSGRRSRIHNANLTDANLAGTKNGHLCTLILTEGLSAMGLALAGISAINGRDRFGVFPLRGKVLNVRDASHDQIMKNAEITAIKQILGLQHKKEYTSTKELRYGHIMIMTDQDHDGSHIKGLLINFFETSFPSLLRIPNFLIEFITPIVKVYKGNIKKPSQAVTFFTMPEYEYWKEHVRAGSGWKHKYFKGLGTSDGEDAKVYFSDLDKHLKEFDTMDPDGRKLIELAFAKTKADERKEWLRQYVPGTYIDHTVDRIKYTEFVNKELILFSIADCARSIPSVVDGLKPGQRKIIYAAFKKNLKTELKVAQLSGYVSEHTGYLHGEASLQGTITNMAQIFVGANNVNLLEPSGNFGSRISGGKDAASARYIFTSLSPFTRKVIPEQDDRLLEYNDDDGMRIEPKWYCPVVPMILVNGADGIGTGWSTSIPSYNPEDIVANIRRLLKGEEVEPMSPWFRGWTGQMERLSEHKFKFTGTIRQIDALTVEVTELPIRMWTQQFKEKLEDIIKAEKTPSWIKDYVDYNSPTKVHFIITLNSEKDMQEALAEGLENRFKLTSTITTTNLVAFDPEGRIKRYTSVEEILEEFYLLRLRYYQMRKDRLLVDLNAELEKLSHQARFIKMVVEGKLILSNRPSKLVAQDLKKNNFPTYSKKKEAEMAGEVEPTVEEDEEVEAEGEASVSGYDYLLKKKPSAS
ncbi:DNA topoisomerase II [Ascodesmis nigricans]|uniref:DNA topoisomerase 2 n=1 Tax=Ascodesmis nigricans TaxID=341454 RepID=A0A4S2N3G2_9PEZI|nr:DNA topoisomerase II [Ascodesmis nigricans]